MTYPPGPVWPQWSAFVRVAVDANSLVVARTETAGHHAGGAFINGAVLHKLIVAYEP